LIDQILPDFYRVTLPMPFRLRHVYIYALVHNGKVALFDTGINIPESFQVLDKALATLGKTAGDIDQIFLTHFHADHCGIAGEIQKRSGAVVYMSAIDEQRIQNNNRAEDVIQRTKDFCLRQGLRQGVLDNLIKQMAFFRNATIPFQVDVQIKPYGKLTVGDRIMESIPAPGHTSGQMCFYFPEEKILLPGDHILSEITPNLSPDPFQTDDRPLRSFLHSLASIRDLPVRMVYPAHGAPLSDLKKRVDEITDHHAERTRLIVKALQGKGKTSFEVSEAIFGTDLPDFDQFLALNETYVHLVDLVDNGIARSEEQDGLILYRTA
jgi:glyoxylase-like metal-dependent hydrolase (beta-lactamase superfamily II)